MRGTVSRPDVPEGFDPGDLAIVRTAEERALINAGIDRYVAEAEAEGDWEPAPSAPGGAGDPTTDRTETRDA